jgi:threonine aldolase
MKSFASDNYAGVLPEVMNALQTANHAHTRSYGADEITKRTLLLFKEVFEADVDVYFVFNGTGANILSISAATQSYNSVICGETSHIYCDESSAPETFTGCRFIPVNTGENGKLTADVVSEKLIRAGDVHFAQPAMVSITQSTEYGTVYTQHEIENIAAATHAGGLLLHMDGARYFNAAASLECSLASISSKAGVDILSLGGTKAGMMYGEAVVVFNKALNKHIAFKHKQVIQLSSKTRFIAAQFEAMLSNELWRRTATHANEMAQILYKRLSAIPEISVTRAVQANAVFAIIPRTWYEPLQEQFPFYIWKDNIHEVRLMCSWDTRLEDVLEFTAAIEKLRTGNALIPDASYKAI